MTSESYEQVLDRAAERCGVESRFWDIFGHEHLASSAAKRSIVQSLGIPVESAESMQDGLFKREAEEWVRVLAPSIVVSENGNKLSIPMTVRESALQQVARFDLRLENGAQESFERSLVGVSAEERWPHYGGWARVTLDLQRTVPLGYHELDVQIGHERAFSRLIVTPRCAWQPETFLTGGKLAGFAVSLYGLRSARNWGFGDFTDLHTLSAWAARDLGVSFLALNPLHAILNRRPYNTSPYLPTSIFFQNCLYLDVEAVEEWSACRRAQRSFEDPTTQRELHLLRESPEVEYERVALIKIRFLKLLFAEFLRHHWRKDTARAQALRNFQGDAGELVTRYGLHCALDEHLHRRDPNLWIWTDWPPEYRWVDSDAVRSFARKHWRSVLFYQYAAWQTSVQLELAQQRAVEAGLSIGLYHDLALATDRFGADIWAHRSFFAPGCRVGSPPDDFSPNGQDWGFPPPNTQRHREDGYRLFRESIRRSCQYGGALRIDHVMRFFRLYWIPDGMDATQGAYVRDRAEDLVRILALESVRSRILVIGEDLGTVEPYIREMLAQYGILSYRLFYFERDGFGSYRLPQEYPRQALVSSTTHDLPTLAGFWTGADIEARRSAGVLDENGHRSQWESRTREKQSMLDALFRANLMPLDYARDAKLIPQMDQPLHNGAMRFLAATPSMLMVVNQEDLTGETKQQNLPGTTSQYPNWGRKMLFTMEQLEQDDDARALTRRMRELLRESGRVVAARVAT